MSVAGAIIADAEAAESLVSDLSTTPRGRLRINAPITFGAVCVAPLVGRYLQAHPHMDVELTLSDRYAEIIDEGYDIAFRVGVLKDSGLAARALPKYRLITCASAAYLAEHGIPQSPEDLVNHHCLGYVTWSGLAYLEWPFDCGGSSQAVQIHPRLQVNDGRVLLAAALDGVGIILQPEPLVAGAIASGALVQILDQSTPRLPGRCTCCSQPNARSLRSCGRSLISQPAILGLHVVEMILIRPASLADFAEASPIGADVIRCVVQRTCGV